MEGVVMVLGENLMTEVSWLARITLTAHGRSELTLLSAVHSAIPRGWSLPAAFPAQWAGGGDECRRLRGMRRRPPGAGGDAPGNGTPLLRRRTGTGLPHQHLPAQRQRGAGSGRWN